MKENTLPKKNLRNKAHYRSFFLLVCLVMFSMNSLAVTTFNDNYWKTTKAQTTYTETTGTGTAPSVTAPSGWSFVGWIEDNGVLTYTASATAPVTVLASGDSYDLTKENTYLAIYSWQDLWYTDVPNGVELDTSHVTVTLPSPTANHNYVYTFQAEENYTLPTSINIQATSATTTTDLASSEYTWVPATGSLIITLSTDVNVDLTISLNALYAPTGFTEVTNAYDNFDDFSSSTSAVDYVNGNISTSTTPWSYEGYGGDPADANLTPIVTAANNHSAYISIPTVGDYIGKKTTLAVGTYIFSYYIKTANKELTSFRLCWDITNPSTTTASQEYSINTATAGSSSGILYTSGEFTITTAGEYDLCAYITKATGAITKIRVDGFRLFKETPSTPTALTLTFNDDYWNRTTNAVQTVTETIAGSGITVPSIEALDGWVLYGWTTETAFTASATAPTDLLSAGLTYAPNATETYTAVYSWISEDNPWFTTTPQKITLNTSHVTATTQGIDATYVNYMFEADENYALPSSITVTRNDTTLTMDWSATNENSFGWDFVNGLYIEFNNTKGTLRNGDYVITLDAVSAPTVTASFTPTDGSVVGLDYHPTITFSEPISYDGTSIIDVATLQTAIDNSFIVLYDEELNEITCTPSISTDNKTVTLSPETDLVAGDYLLELDTSKIDNITQTSSFSGPSDIAFTASDPYILASPTNLTATVHTTSIDLAWNAVANATGYSIYITDYDTENTITITDSTYTCLNLTTNTEYGIIVTAIGTSPYIDSEGVEIDRTTPTNTVLTITTEGDFKSLHTGGYESIVVEADKSLTIDESTDVNALTIYPGASVTVSESTEFSTEALHIIGQDDNPASFSLSEGESISTYMDYSIVLTDNTRYHFFSLPYDCNFDDILVDGVNTLDNIGILEYEPGELANGHSDNWIDLKTGDVLKANVGYCIATCLTTSPKVTFTPVESLFSFTNDINKTMTLLTTKGFASTEYQGWSLVGSPYLDAMGSGLYRKPAGISFVSKPNFSDNCWTYTQTAIGDATIEAFSSYFVQVGETTDMTFEFPTSYVSGGPLLKEDRLKLSLSNLAGETDPTYIDVQTQYTTDYEIGSDLRKMLGQGTRPQFFSLSGQEQRAFNAIPETAMNNIPLGIYTGTTDQYTITADNATRYNATHLYLTDLLTQVTTDLMISPYTFAGTAHTLNTSRFVLNIERNNVPTTCDPTEANGLLIYAEQGLLSIQNLVLGSQLDIIDATGKIVYHRNVTSTSLNLKAATGLYIIRVTLHDGSFTSYKTIL